MCDFQAILAEARRDPTLQNTLDIDALLRAGVEETGADDDPELETLEEMAKGVVGGPPGRPVTPRGGIGLFPAARRLPGHRRPP